jgi:hypothetical protein
MAVVGRFSTLKAVQAHHSRVIMASEEEAIDIPALERMEETEKASTEGDEVENAPPLTFTPPAKPVNPMVVSKRWKEYYDEASQRFYYFDRVTKGVQWRKPKGFLTRKELLRPVSANQIGTSDWKVVSTLVGKDYFFNTKTGVVAWELPADFNTPIPIAPSELSVEAEPSADKKRGRQEDLEEPDNYGLPFAKRPKLAEEPKLATSFVERFEDSKESVATNFKLMLESNGVDKDALWSDWQPRLVKDGRFNAVASLAERRSLFESHIRQLAADYKQKRKKVLEEAQNALWREIETANLKPGIGFDAFKDQFRPTEAYQRLRDLHPDSIGDLYDEAMRVANKAREKNRARAKQDFLAMLEEKIRDRYLKNTKQDWLDFKLDLESDPRYNRAQLSGGDREQLFEDFASELRHSQSSRADPKSRDAHPLHRDTDERHEVKDSRRRGEEAIKAREAEAARQRSREDRDIRERHERAREDRERDGFRTLLAERVLRSNLTWDDLEPSLSRDPRFETQYLSTKGKMKLFDDHIYSLQRDAERAFIKYLDQRGNDDFYLTWQEASDSLFGTPAFGLFQTNSERERAYSRWASARIAQAEKDLQALFATVPLITSDTELENKKELLPILDELRKDARWRALPDSSEKWASRRMELLEQFVESLASK